MVRGPPIRQIKNIKEACDVIRRSVGSTSFKYVKYNILYNNDKNKVEEAMVEMIINQSITPSAIENKIPKDLFDRLERK